LYSSSKRVLPVVIYSLRFSFFNVTKETYNNMKLIALILTTICISGRISVFAQCGPDALETPRLTNTTRTAPVRKTIVPDVKGTIWTITSQTNGDNYTSLYNFLPSGKVRWTSFETPGGIEGKWSQRGATVEIEWGVGCTETGTIRGNQMNLTKNKDCGDNVKPTVAYKGVQNPYANFRFNRTGPVTLNPPARLFDVFGSISYCDLAARIDNVTQDIRQLYTRPYKEEATAEVYVIAYTGRNVQKMDAEQVKAIELERRTLVGFITRGYGYLKYGKSRIKINFVSIDAGFRDDVKDFKIELWIVPY
jgi:hypothetical protein